jgi:hypothetical protein
MLGDKANTSRFTCAGPLFTGGHPLQVPNILVPPGSADIFCSYLGMTSLIGFRQGSVNIGTNPDSVFAINSVKGNINIYDTNISKHTGFFNSLGATYANGKVFKALSTSSTIAGKVSKMAAAKVLISGKKQNLSSASGVLSGNWTFNGIRIETVAHGHSDARLKRSVIPIEDALEKVSKLNGVSFRWNRNYAEYRRDLKTKTVSRSIGFIAQEVEKIVPEVISTDKIDNFDFEIKKVDYGQMVALLTEAIKEQQTQIESLKEEIKDLKSQLNS